MKEGGELGREMRGSTVAEAVSAPHILINAVSTDQKKSSIEE